MEQGFVTGDLIDITGVVKYFEQRTRCELAVRITDEKVMPEQAARGEFTRLGLDRAGGRGLLVYLNTFQRTTVILSGRAISDKLGSDWAREFADILSERFRKYQFGFGLHEMISKMALLLGEHFPPTSKSPPASE